MKRITRILCLFMLTAQLFAVGEAGAIFLLIAPGAGPAGTGEAQVAKADDAYASYYNPAGLGFLSGREAAGMHVNWLPNLADDIYYDFLTYRREIAGIGSLGAHLIFLNLGSQVQTDAEGNELGNFNSNMWAITTSLGTNLTETSSVGIGFKILQQNLGPGAGSEANEGKSTDFLFDVGYLKKFGKSSIMNIQKKEKIVDLFNKLSEIYVNQKLLTDTLATSDNKDKLINEQILVLDELIELRAEFSEFDFKEIIRLDEGLNAAINDINQLLDLLRMPNESKTNELTLLADRILFDLMEIDVSRGDILAHSTFKSISANSDKFNFGLSVTNIGPKIWFQDQTQADPAPTNMRIGIFSNVYNDGFNKVNLMFDANKLLVSRYQEMDWNGDGIISGDDELAHDDPWYTAVFTSWLDDWYYGGDYNLDDDTRIGGYSWEDINGNSKIDMDELSASVDSDGEFLAFSDSEYGIYGNCEPSSSGMSPDECKEKGSGDDRSFSTELEEMVYNMGAEYWYTDNFVLRGGYIYDQEGKITNPTFGAGIRFAQYGFDFGYTAGEQGHPRANTMFFSVNITL